MLVKRSRLLLTLSFAILLFNLLPSAQATNVLVNGDFSAGLTGWSIATAPGMSTGTCGYNADTAPGTEALTATPGFTTVSGTAIALGSVSVTAPGRYNCVLYQDVTLPAGAKWASLSADTSRKSNGAMTINDHIMRVMLSPVGVVPNLVAAGDQLPGTIGLGPSGAGVALSRMSSATSWNISAYAGTTVRFAFVSQVSTPMGGTGAPLAGNVVVGLGNMVLDIIVDPPLAGNSSAVVIQNSGVNSLQPLVFGTVTSLNVTSAASHGTAVVNGTKIDYTPAPGFVGTDSFALTASNFGGTSNPAVFTVHVVTPTTAIPTLSEWGLIILSSLLGLFAIWRMRSSIRRQA